MAETKRIISDTSTTGMTVYAIVEREIDSFILDASSGVFASSTNSPFLPMTENAVIKGRYSATESRDAWDNGKNNIAIYNQTAAGSSSPVADKIIATGQMVIFSDLEVFLDNQVSSLDFRVQSLDTRVDSLAVNVASNTAAITSLQVVKTNVVDVTGISEGRQRIEAGDTFQFTKNLITVPDSAAVSIYFSPTDESSATLITSLATASQSGSTANFFYFHTDSGTNYTTVDSSGNHFIEWTVFRPTGNDIIRDYFEIIKTD